MSVISNNGDVWHPNHIGYMCNGCLYDTPDEVDYEDSSSEHE